MVHDGGVDGGLITKYSIPVVDGVAAGVDGAALLAIAALRRAGNAPSDGCTAQKESVACAICCKSFLRSALAAADRALRRATITGVLDAPPAPWKLPQPSAPRPHPRRR